MGTGPIKPTGDIVRPVPALARRTNDGTRSAPARGNAPPSPATTAPRSSASIPSLAPGQSLEQAVPVIPSATRGTGKPLEPALQATLGARLHTDFGDVRVHTGEQAAKSTEALQAKAFTVGRDIVFGAGQYQPDSSAGQHLLAHELAHVAQPEAPSARDISHSGDTSEIEADHAANAVMQGHCVQPHAVPAATIQREPKDDADTTHQSVLDRMLDKASPFLAASAGSASLDNFDTGKADLKPIHLKTLKKTAASIITLLRQYPQSTVTIIGHTDTVGTEANNLTLGQARADATAKALEELGVSADILLTRSEGEGAPLAVPTKDETPQAKNRRVEVRFEPNAAVNPVTAPKLEPKKEEKPPITFQTTPPPDLNYHPPVDPDYQGPPYRQKNDWPDKFGKEIPPARGGKSPIDVIGEKVIDPVVDKVAGWLPYKAREKIKEGARDAITSGTAKLARAAAESQGVKDTTALDAIEKAAEAAIKEKGTYGADSPP